VRTRYPEHLKAFDYIGFHRYFLTFCTLRRRRHFVTADKVDLVRSQIVRAAAREGHSLLAYCYMPDHAHVLVEGVHATAHGRRFIALAKQFSAFHFKRTFGEALWQRYGYERVLRNEEGTLSVARYIVENPLRAGLVANICDYAFVGSETYGRDALFEAVQGAPGWRRSG
jgi:putative transposase